MTKLVSNFPIKYCVFVCWLVVSRDTVNFEPIMEHGRDRQSTCPLENVTLEICAEIE